MPIDYSKWDKLELSDDSDVEVHPNVDKQSFIRWKQQDIHQKRAQRNQDIATLEVQVPMYEELNRRVDQLLSDNTDDKLGDYQGICKYLNDKFDGSKPKGVEENAPTYNEMIEDLFTDLMKQLEKTSQDPKNGALLRKEILNHRKKIDDVLFTQKVKLQSLYKERELHISSDDIHTGWDRSFLNKGESKPVEQPIVVQSKPAATSSTAPESVPPATTKSAPPASTSVPSTTSKVVATTSQVAGEGEMSDLHPNTIELSHIRLEDINKIKNYLKEHTYIITQHQKDALLMSAFDAQFAHDDASTKQIIGHSILLQYVMDIMKFKNVNHPLEIQQIVEQMFTKMFQGASTQAVDAFQSELQSTFAHIKQRCEVLSQEQQGEQEIQLKSLDNDTELVVNLPDAKSDDTEEKRRYELFLTLPEAMQKALQSESLDEVNDVFHGMPIEKAEQILEIFEETDIIGVKAVLENENEWEQLKDEYAKHTDQEPEAQELEIENKSLETADIVD
jgi:cell division cycle protein 37